MNEFKIIPQAPDYKMNKDGDVRRVINDKPLFLIGGKAFLKKPDGTMQHFIIEDLVNELFGNENTEGRLRSQVVDFVSNNKVIVQSETNPAGDLIGRITYVNLTTQEQKAMKKEESNTNESEDANLVKDNEKPKAKRDKFEWTFIGKTDAGKSSEHSESKVLKKKKEKVKKSIQKKVGVVADKISGPVTKEAATKEITRIISLDCSESMKIWKLHQVGCTNEEILLNLNLPKEKSKKCLNTIWNYKHNPSMRKKADLK